MIIRKYRSSDCAAILRLFYDTVHGVNSQDYTPAQLDAWATGREDPEQWDRSLSEHYTLVALRNESLVGFGDIDQTGYLDRLYVHKDHQREGIASALCGALEQAVPGRRISTHASITARPFFEKRGYRLISVQKVERHGIMLTNYVMEKDGV